MRLAGLAAVILSVTLLMGWEGSHAADSTIDKLGFSTSQPEKGPSVEVEGGFLVPYTLTVPGSSVTIEMVPIPGGVFTMGSPEAEEGHSESESPQVKVEVGPMWVAKYETSWKEYNLYMSMYELFKTFESEGIRQVNKENAVDAVTAPTALYDPSFTFEFGQEPTLPAVTMTQFAAKQYTKWLSKLTGHQYRLPSEAEWEYACRAGSTTAYCFGNDPAELDDYAWYFDNSDEMPHEVGKKKPNAFGLHDMHGNVMELVIDGYSEDGYASIADKPQPVSFLEAIRWSDSSGNRAVRGGSWQDDAEQCRSAARIGTEDEDWKEEDPNIPLSPWWYTNDPARGVGFRICRSYQALDDEIIKKFWEIDHEDIELDVEMRITEGRGTQRTVDPSLAEAIKDAASE